MLKKWPTALQRLRLHADIGGCTVQLSADELTRIANDMWMVENAVHEAIRVMKQDQAFYDSQDGTVHLSHLNSILETLSLKGVV